MRILLPSSVNSRFERGTSLSWRPLQEDIVNIMKRCLVLKSVTSKHPNKIFYRNLIATIVNLTNMFKVSEFTFPNTRQIENDYWQCLTSILLPYRLILWLRLLKIVPGYELRVLHAISSATINIIWPFCKNTSHQQAQPKRQCCSLQIPLLQKQRGSQTYCRVCPGGAQCGT